MKYSVVIPAYNAENTISEAVNSVLRQFVAPEEIIVVDDGSTDNTVRIVENLEGPIKLLKQTNSGPGHATTTGIKQVTTKTIATLDSDDLWLPHKMERQLEELCINQELSGVFSRIKTFRNLDDPNDPGQVSDGWLRTTMVIRTEVALFNGDIIDPAGGAGEMIDWLARIRESGNVLKQLPEVLALRRIREGSLSYNKTSARDSGYLNVARAAILRRREAEKLKNG
ncbi:MAG: glycosyltransferase family 2 protein [Methyloligellaceae bacterium]